MCSPPRISSSLRSEFSASDSMASSAGASPYRYAEVSRYAVGSSVADSPQLPHLVSPGHGGSTHVRVHSSSKGGDSNSMTQAGVEESEDDEPVATLATMVARQQHQQEEQQLKLVNTLAAYQQQDQHLKVSRALAAQDKQQTLQQQAEVRAALAAAETNHLVEMAATVAEVEQHQDSVVAERAAALAKTHNKNATALAARFATLVSTDRTAMQEIGDQEGEVDMVEMLDELCMILSPMKVGLQSKTRRFNTTLSVEDGMLDNVEEAKDFSRTKNLMEKKVQEQKEKMEAALAAAQAEHVASIAIAMTVKEEEKLAAVEAKEKLHTVAVEQALHAHDDELMGMKEQIEQHAQDLSAQQQQSETAAGVKEEEYLTVISSTISELEETHASTVHTLQQKLETIASHMEATTQELEMVKGQLQVQQLATIEQKQATALAAQAAADKSEEVVDIKRETEARLEKASMRQSKALLEKEKEHTAAMGQAV